MLTGSIWRLSLSARSCRWGLLLALACVLWFGGVTGFAQRARGGRQPPRRGAAPVVNSAAPQEFDRLVKEATAAREGGQFDEAIGLYRQALRLRPKWAEGWWYVATLLYDRDRYKEAAAAFKEASRLQPRVGAIWGMLGLCEFQLGAYDEALAHLHQAQQVGLAENKELTRSLRYHEGLINLLKGQFELAQRTLDGLSSEGLHTENLIIALGLAVLRIPALPQSITPHYKDRDLIRRAGWAQHLLDQKNFPEAQREYERLIADYPKTANVHYAYGRFLLTQRQEEEAVKAFEREIANTPNHAMARLQIAYNKLSNRDPAAGLPFAEEAMRLYPNFPLGHYILGRLLFDTGQNERAIEALETFQRMSPSDPKVYFALARAYTRARRKADADRARETFERLNRQAEGAATQAAGSDFNETPPADAGQKP